MGADEVRQFLSHLAVEGRVSASTQNVALCALLFLYRDVLRVGLPDVEGVERAKRPARLPAVFTRAGVAGLLSHLSGTYKLMAGLLYGSGLRLMEALRVKDLDFGYMEILVRDGKGGKDRRTTLPRPLADPPSARTGEAAARARPASWLRRGPLFCPDNRTRPEHVGPRLVCFMWPSLFV
jgi:integrase